ncbi:hypothetical protein Ctob_002047 [Chrysochromulina tobinii]|uniref:Uncharacterized protein n=1 Tax=Chrysochromulina tobinii TaxID=1460289 RepID=A0A0M0J940_9EUKA|nr:hypothetical protein Ctob_002047 [Chrysochromulina tobinii]|eukprot:KOO22872.1 hypothetical protein Ctob_002047 [Chrysochromulina sp. CCMP291]
MRLFALVLFTSLLLGAGAWLAPPGPRLRFLSPPRRAVVFASAEYTAKLDLLIRKLRASAPDQLPRILAENLKAIDQRLFLRLAEMSDAESDDYEKLRIRQLATLVASSLETILAKADEQMDADAGVVQQFLRLMASESGEFVLPVPKARLDTLRTSMRGRVAMLDGGFVGTVKAYMQKASDDGLDGVVDVLRVLLQVFASERLRSLTTSQLAAGGAAGATLAALLEASPDQWDDVLKVRVSGEKAECSAQDVLNVLQDKMGEIVLGMPAGSPVQTVLAEYLSELLSRARAIAAEE